MTSKTLFAALWIACFVAMASGVNCFLWLLDHGYGDELCFSLGVLVLAAASGRLAYWLCDRLRTTAAPRKEPQP